MNGKQPSGDCREPTAAIVGRTIGIGLIGLFSSYSGLEKR